VTTGTITPAQKDALLRTARKLVSFDAQHVTAPLGVQRRTMETLTRLGLVERHYRLGIRTYSMTDAGREYVAR